MIKVAINGFGRIGRSAFKIAYDKFGDQIEIVAVNDLADNKTLADLLKHDSNYGLWKHEVTADEKNITVDGKNIRALSENKPNNLPWKELAVDIVLECTGVFTSKSDASKHLSAGAKRVIISAPPKSPDIPTFVLGVNEEKFDPAKDLIISNGSCTTNCLAPLVKVLHQAFEIEYNLMTTIHAYTNDQKLLDLPHRDLRRARAAAQNMIPTTTGAAKSVVMTIPELKGKLDGIAIRVPVPVVSIIDLVCLVKKPTTVEEVNNKFKELAEGKLKGILGVAEEPLVSSDFKGDSRSAIVDLALTMVSKKGGGTGGKGNLIKVVAWYDNEWGYASRYAEIAEYVGGTRYRS